MKTINFFVLNMLFACSLFAQERQIPLDTLVTTNHSTTIKGVAVNSKPKRGFNSLMARMPALARYR